MSSPLPARSRSMSRVNSYANSHSSSTKTIPQCEFTTDTDTHLNWTSPNSILKSVHTPSNSNFSSHQLSSSLDVLTSKSVTLSDEWYFDGIDGSEIPKLVQALFPSISSLLEIMHPLDTPLPTNPLLNKGIIAGVTRTVMLRNIPARFTAQDLFRFIDSVGFEETYDFLHLPTDFGTRCCKGYAFLNFANPNLVPIFVNHLTDYAMGDSKSLYICAAVQQGIDNSLRSIKPATLHKMSKLGLGPFLRDGDGNMAPFKNPHT